MGVLGSGKGLKRRGAPVGFMWAEFQLELSHSDLFHAQNNDFLCNRFLLGSAGVLGNVPPGFWDCVSTTQRVLRLKSV